MGGHSYADDFIAISQVKARYCRFLDTKDWAAFTDLFTEDFEHEFPQRVGVRIIRGREEAIKTIRMAVETATTAHQVHNLELEVDGDVAQGIWAMQDRVIWGPDRTDVMSERGHVGYGHYRERYERKDGRWRIAAQKLSYLIYDSEART